MLHDLAVESHEVLGVAVSVLLIVLLGKYNVNVFHDFEVIESPRCVADFLFVLVLRCVTLCCVGRYVVCE